MFTYAHKNLQSLIPSSILPLSHRAVKIDYIVIKLPSIHWKQARDN